MIEKKSIFQNNKVENSKNFQILWSKIDVFNFLQTINFGTFMLENGNFLHMFILGILQENKESSSLRLIQKPQFYHKIGTK